MFLNLFLHGINLVQLSIIHSFVRSYLFICLFVYLLIYLFTWFVCLLVFSCLFVCIFIYSFTHPSILEFNEGPTVANYKQEFSITRLLPIIFPSRLFLTSESRSKEITFLNLVFLSGVLAAWRNVRFVSIRKIA